MGTSRMSGSYVSGYVILPPPFDQVAEKYSSDSWVKGYKEQIAEESGWVWLPKSIGWPSELSGGDNNG